MSNAAFHLTADDFYVDNGSKSKILCIKSLRGISVVLFWSNRCEFCPQTVQIFKDDLPNIIPNVQFGLINITQHPKIAYMSKVTNTPITYVPYIVLYVNSIPFLRYESDKTAESLVNFVNGVVQRIKPKLQFIENNNMKLESDSVVEYNDQSRNKDQEAARKSPSAAANSTSGIPYNIVCDAESGKCYLNLNQAYRSNVTNAHIPASAAQR
jgi:thioredoxin-like negative regulator of GroEL